MPNEIRITKVSLIIICVFSVLPPTLCTTKFKLYMHPLSDDFIRSINIKQQLWTAGRNFHEKTPMGYFKRLMGTLHEDHSDIHIKKQDSSAWFPEEFDATLMWRDCPSIKTVRDQGNCGSCWAVAAVSVMTDRYCIHNDGRKQFNYSIEDVLSCCTNCGFGCDGGSLKAAWFYSNENGIVSGGPFDSELGCIPYLIPPCDHRSNDSNTCFGYVKTPQCHKQCISSYDKTYYSDKHRVKVIYRVNNIESEIYNSGPVSTTMRVYEDFLSYKSGIYRYTTGKELGKHSVKIIGYGKINNTKYWLVVNSFNTTWGDNGFFKIIRGVNHCQIESNVIIGNPVLN